MNFNIAFLTRLSFGPVGSQTGFNLELPCKEKIQIIGFIADCMGLNGPNEL